MGTSLILIYLLHKISFDSIYSFLEISFSRGNLFSRQVMKLILICSRIGKRVDENINLRGVWGKTMPINCGPLKEKIKLFVLENESARILLRNAVHVVVIGDCTISILINISSLPLGHFSLHSRIKKDKR